MSTTRICYNNCTQPQVCHLYDDTKIGWCPKCNFCNESGCKQPREYREDIILDQETFRIMIYRDVCRKHAIRDFNDNTLMSVHIRAYVKK